MSVYLHQELHPQLLIMRDFNLINWFITCAYPYCTILPFTNHVQDTFSNTLCPVVIQKDNGCFIACLKFVSQLLLLYKTE
jgi:hypothetical protein